MEGDENGIEITASEDSTRELAETPGSALIRFPLTIFNCFLLNASEIKLVPTLRFGFHNINTTHFLPHLNIIDINSNMIQVMSIKE